MPIAKKRTALAVRIAATVRTLACGSERAKKAAMAIVKSIRSAPPFFPQHQDLQAHLEEHPEEQDLETNKRSATM
jgi:hypothetical protein